MDQKEALIQSSGEHPAAFLQELQNKLKKQLIRVYGCMSNNSFYFELDSIEVKMQFLCHLLFEGEV